MMCMQATCIKVAADGWSPDSVELECSDVFAMPPVCSRRPSVLGYAAEDAALLPTPLLAAHQLIGWEGEFTPILL